MSNHEWAPLYQENVERYRTARPKRANYIIDFLRSRNEEVPRSILEVGAFSGKDIAELSTLFTDASCYAMDREIEVFSRGPGENVSCMVADAFRMPFRDGTFDIVFHSGLIVLFDNEQASLLVTEQVRVCRGLAFVFGHNQSNIFDLIMSSIRVAKGDSLYKFRRFSAAEMLDLVPPDSLLESVEYTDNMLENFVGRTMPFLLGPLRPIARLLRRWLCNEIVVVCRT